MYEITGRYLSAGAETPHFDVQLRSLGVNVARITSDGRGGCALVEWSDAAPKGSATRTNASAWLASEARRIWTRDTGESAPKLLDRPMEAAILVIPEYL